MKLTVLMPKNGMSDQQEALAFSQCVCVCSAEVTCSERIELKRKMHEYIFKYLHNVLPC